MNRSPDTYDQNYYENRPDNYDQLYETEMEQFPNNCGDPSSLQVPDVRLYTDDVQNMTEIYSRNSPFNDSLLPLEMPKRIANVQPTEFFYDAPPNQHYESAVATERQTALPPRTSNYHYSHCYEYQPYITDYSTARQNHSLVHGRSDEIYFDDGYEDSYSGNYPHNNGSPHVCKVHQNKIKACTLHQNYGGYKMQPVETRMKSKKYVKDVCIDYREKNFHGNTLPRGAPVRKQPVTVKTPKYFTKNVLPTTVSKRASVLCLPVVTQADPALTKRKSRTSHQTRKNTAPPKATFSNGYDQCDTFSTHKMHSQGDVKEHLAPKGLQTFLHKYEDDMEQEDFYDVNAGNIDQREDNGFKEFAKFLKPRVPSSIKFRQEKLANLKAQKSLQPKLKLSLDKLLNRLQKCENSDNLDKVSGGSSQVDTHKMKNEQCQDKREMKIDKVNSFNYETLSRKCSPTNEESEVFNPGSIKPVSKLFGSMEPKRSARLVRPMDDHCALDLHKSKSYIVDLIDRALSKELGTVPRDQTVYNNWTPNKAVATISRQQQFNHPKGVCYEVTAALTDSIISNASAPPNLDSNQIVERSRSQGEMKDKDEDGYIKQLKQLRWGHIRHIQHEARRLADLEEFLEKCGEIEY